MAEVSQEMILDYMMGKGGVVKNVDLVRHFRKFLQLDDPLLKERAREIFKERVNAVAYIKAEKGEKYLYLKQELHPAGGLHRPPSGRPSITSIEDSHKTPYPDQRDSLSSLLSSFSIGSNRTSAASLQLGDRGGAHVAGNSHQNTVLQSFRPISNTSPYTTKTNSPSPRSSSFSPPPTTSSSSLNYPPTSSNPRPPPSSANSSFNTPPASSSSLFSPPPEMNRSLFSSPPVQTTGPAEDDGESLLAQMTAELSSFGSLFNSFGTSSLTTSLDPAKPTPLTTSAPSHSSPSQVASSKRSPASSSSLAVRSSLEDAPTTTTFESRSSPFRPSDTRTTTTFEPQRKQGNSPTTSPLRQQGNSPTTSPGRQQGNSPITSPGRQQGNSPTSSPQRQQGNSSTTSIIEPRRLGEPSTTSTFVTRRPSDPPGISTFESQRLNGAPFATEQRGSGPPIEPPMANEQKRPVPTFKPPLDNKRLGPQGESPPVGRRPLGHLPSEPRRLGPPVELPPSSPSRKPHPLADVNGRRQGSSDSTRRQGSMERMHSPMFSPQIMVESPTHSIDSYMYHNSVFSPGASHTSLSPGTTSSLRDRPNSGVGPNGSIVSNTAVQLRTREKSPLDGKVGRSYSITSSVRKSRNLDKNLDSITRASITMTPPSARRKLPPTVAPKPRRETGAARSAQDLANEGDDEGSLTAISDQAEGEFYEIDPLEKEWMLAAAQADMDSLHQLLIADPTLINRKDFIQGYTALHWAAKHGRCDIISAMIMNGAHVEIKSNGGFTPLHLAAQTGHDNAIQQLIRECDANIDARDHGGKKPIHMLNPKASERTRILLSRLNTYGLPLRAEGPEHLPTFSQPSKKKSSLERPWSSVGQLYDRRIDAEKVAKRHLSPRLSIRKSFSFKSKVRKEHSPSKKDKAKRPRSSLRPDWDV